MIEGSSAARGLSPWRERAACRGADINLFFIERGQGVAGAAEAKALCANCPVSDECRTFALAGGERHGVWGGMSVEDRKRARRGMTMPVLCPQCDGLFDRTVKPGGHAAFCGPACRREAKLARQRRYRTAS